MLRIRLLRDKKELGVEVGYRLADDVAEVIVGLPPMLRNRQSSELAIPISIILRAHHK